ncbi:hypothetical protein [Fluviicola sp.]|uniref:hypothetical protein n=1 Tax=Fluviicola sp. TaxID=1917219 RepID=UPI003D2AECAF
MPTLKNSITINRDVSTENDLDFDYLRRIGIQHIASMGGGLWTDYNEHDPGITILEMLSYAITDLGNRASLSIADLLTGPEGSTPISKQFYTAEQILPNRALTALDYRKLFLDIEGVRNCWIIPYDVKVYANCKDGSLAYNPELFPNILPEDLGEFNLKGLNRILVDFDVENDDPQRQQKIDAIKLLIKTKYHANRNLCEDLVKIDEVEEQPISICVQVGLENEADEDEVNARIFLAIEGYLSPRVRFYSLKQMLEKGYRMDEVFEGPLLDHGFIDTAELREAGLRKEVRLSDIINIIMDIPGVKQVMEISIGNCSGSNNPDTWLICIDPNKRPCLCGQSVFNYKKEQLPVRVNEKRSEEIYQELKAEEDATDDQAALNRFPEIPSGESLDTGWYTTIQNDFPDTYGIGQEGLVSSADTVRRSKAKQLKAYLLFFDQILASYFSHLENAKKLLSINSDLSNTYFTQAVSDISGFTDLVNHYPQNDNTLLSEQLFEGLADDVARRNELLDHLLARFAENFSKYAFVMKELYGSFTSEMILKSKELFLKEYVTLSSERGLGFNYYHQPVSELWDTGNVSGVEKRVARLSGIKNYFRRNLSESFIEVYEQSPGVFKWRIRNASATVILSAENTYTSYKKAINNLYFAVLQLIESSEEKIEDAFQAGVVTNQIIDNIQVKLSGSGNYYFAVINPELPSTDPEYVLAKQLIYFSQEEDMEASLLETIRFMKYDFTEEGMFTVEHILLRPDSNEPDTPTYYFMPVCADDCKESCCGIDPYSFRVSIVLPGYTQRFSDIHFRNFMEELIREELPSHILAKICWIGSRKGEVPDDENQMMEFERLYKQYLIAKSPMNPFFPQDETRDFISILTRLHTIFPTGKLHNCDAEEEEQSDDIILGRTKLGTL